MTEFVKVGGELLEKPSRELDRSEKIKMTALTIFNALSLVFIGATLIGEWWIGTVIGVALVSLLIWSNVKERFAFGRWQFSAGSLRSTVENFEQFEEVRKMFLDKDEEQPQPKTRILFKNPYADN